MIASAHAKNFDLSPEEFEQLERQLRKGDETLFQAIFLAHFGPCMAYLIKEYNVQSEKAYDLTMDTLLLFRRKLLDRKIKYGNLRFLFTQMACHIYLKKTTRSPSLALKKEVQTLLHEEQYTLDPDELKMLNKSWDQLGPTCKNLLKRVYYHKEAIKDIAEEQQKPAGSLRKQKQRCIIKLREYFNAFKQL